jgi:hypothetical protein
MLKEIILEIQAKAVSDSAITTKYVYNYFCSIFSGIPPSPRTVLCMDMEFQLSDISYSFVCFNL